MSTAHKQETVVQKTECLLIPLLEDKRVSAQLGMVSPQVASYITRLFDDERIDLKKLQTALVYPEHDECSLIILVGLGKTKEASIRTWKQAVGVGVIAAQQKKVQTVSLVIPDEVRKTCGARQLGEATTIAIELSGYAYDIHKSDPENRVTTIREVKSLIRLSAVEKKSFMSGWESGVRIAGSINLVRTLANTPPNHMTPTVLANAALDVGKQPNVTVTVLSKDEIQDLGMGCFLGVAQGSTQEPKFIILEYRGGGKKEKPVVLVGKGITFDSGGLSLKPDPFMNDMKFDMIGAATVLGIIDAAAKLGIKKNIVGLMPACENMPSGSAYRPDDILTAMNGKTVEIVNTDAEGRLILADALCYAARYEPKEVIDFATLTGACLVALGNERSGLFSAHDRLTKKLLSSAEKVGEQLWPLPLGPEFSDAMKSDVADIKNLGGVGGNPRYGGASTGAAFLQFFTTYPWAHIDLASSYLSQKGKPWMRGGANGFAIETVLDYLRG